MGDPPYQGSENLKIPIKNRNFKGFLNNVKKIALLLYEGFAYSKGCPKKSCKQNFEGYVGANRTENVSNRYATNYSHKNGWS